MKLSEIAKIEASAADSLPVKYLEYYYGWRLRFNDGVSRRANSVLAEKSGLIGLEQKLDYAEKFYKGHLLATRFQLNIASKPVELAELLLARAYTKSPGAKVQIANLSVLSVKKPKHKIELLNKADPTWLDIYEKVEIADDYTTKIRREMLNRMPESSAFFKTYIDNEPAAVGLAVLQRGYVGIFNMATKPTMRKRGAARSIVYAMAHWASERDARKIYLQVTKGNVGAQRAYEKMGFVTAYEYDYYTKKG